MNFKAIPAMAGFVIMGLSPSFVDWQQAPEKRKEMLLFYGIGLTLIYLGLFT
jgi:hypothetical protein